MYGQARKHGITELVGSFGSPNLFIHFSFPVLIAMMYFKLLYRVVFVTSRYVQTSLPMNIIKIYYEYH